jgi:hypothetical protein
MNGFCLCCLGFIISSSSLCPSHLLASTKFNKQIIVAATRKYKCSKVLFCDGSFYDSLSRPLPSRTKYSRLVVYHCHNSAIAPLLWALLALQAGRFRDWIPVGARFSTPVHTDPGAHPASYKMGTRSFLGVKRPCCAADHPPPSTADVKERVEIYLYSPSGTLWPVLGWIFTLIYLTVL